MRKAFGVALGAAIVGGLALAAFSIGATDHHHQGRAAALGDDSVAQARLAARATDKYKGRFKNAGGAKIIIKAKTEGGVPTKIKRMAFRRLPGTCPSGIPLMSGGWTLSGVPVNSRRRFKAAGESEDGTSSLRFRGKFSADYDKVKGRFQTTYHYGPESPPEETCVSENKRYVAKR